MVQYRKEYHINNKERLQAYHKQYYQTNKEKLLGYQNEYYKNHKKESQKYYMAGHLPDRIERGGVHKVYHDNKKKDKKIIFIKPTEPHDGNPFKIK